jgi:hypothetical protein
MTDKQLSGGNMTKKMNLWINWALGLTLLIGLISALAFSNNGVVKAQKIIFTATPTAKPKVINPIQVQPVAPLKIPATATTLPKPVPVNPVQVQPITPIQKATVFLLPTVTPVIHTDILHFGTPGGIVPIKILPPPTLLSPANGIITNNASPTFSWTSVTGAVSYNLQVSHDKTFSTVDNNYPVTGTSVQVDFWDSDVVWYWRVSGVNGNQTALWSSVRSFTLDTIPPDAPVLVKPSNGSLALKTATFSWQSVLGANAYQFHYMPFGIIAKSTSYTSSVLSGTSIVPSGLKSNGVYSWNVRARDAAGNWGDWCNPWKVTIK